MSSIHTPPTPTPTLEITMNFRADPKKRSILLEDDLKSYHMMLVWDKSKPTDHIKEYAQIKNDLTKLLIENNNVIYFIPRIACTNSTYGELDDWLTNYILNLRREKTWIFTGKDLKEVKEGQVGNYGMFAHISRRMIEEGSPLRNSLSNVAGQVIKINIVQYVKKPKVVK